MSRSRGAARCWRSGAVVPACLLLSAGLAGCTEDEPPEEPAASNSPHGGTEPITREGVAAVVRDALGAEEVERFGAYPDDGSRVSVMVSVRGADPRDMFMVAATAAAMADKVPTCENVAIGGCVELADGKVVSWRTTEGGFSEDNSEGMVVYASAQVPGGTGATAMYESYDDEPPITVEQLADLVSDPRLTWETGSATNEAGADIDIEDLTG